MIHHNLDTFNTIPEILEDIRLGKIVIMLDDDDRENEGDFIMAAEMVTPEAINFMARYGRGLICTPVAKSLAEKLNLYPMVTTNTATYETAFTVSIDAKQGISTGISANDRAHSIRLMTESTTVAEDFVRPGHIFPLIAKDGGVMKRRGHTEAAVDLAGLAGLKSIGVICEILKDNGELARTPELFQLARQFHLKIGTIHDLVAYLEQTQPHQQGPSLSSPQSITEISRVDFPTKYGHFKLSLFRSIDCPNEEHLALHLGDFPSVAHSSTPTLVRLHSECLTGDTFGSLRCDCGEQLDLAMQAIMARGHGLLIYLKQEGRGIGLSEKLRAYALQDQGRDTVEANLELGHAPDKRSYEFARSILTFFGLTNIELLTNNPDKIHALDQFGFFVKRTPLLIHPNHFNLRYYQTKKEKMGHLFNELI